MWKLCLEFSGKKSQKQFNRQVKPPNWDSLCKIIERTLSWNKLPPENFDVFHKLHAVGFVLPPDLIPDLLTIFTSFDIARKNIPEFFGQVYEETRKFVLKRGYETDILITRLKSGSRAYISLTNLLTIPDPEILLNLLAPQSPEDLEDNGETAHCEITSEKCAGLRGVKWNTFLSLLQEHTKNGHVDIFSIIDGAEHKTAGGVIFAADPKFCKGTGVFFTSPDLVKPTVERTIDPLIYQNTEEGRGIISPEEITCIKILDPAMGQVVS